MKTKISESGLIGTDGKMRLPMERLNEFFAAHAGKRIVMTIEAVVPGSSAAQLSYYFRYIVPTIQQALYELGERKTEKQVDLWLRQQCGYCYNDYGGLLEARQMTQPDFSDFLDWIKQYAAENLYVYIEDSKSL